MEEDTAARTRREELLRHPPCSSPCRIDLSPILPYLFGVIAVEERRLKGLLKSAVAEVLQERRDLLRDAIRESFEDVALVRAIQLGERSRSSPQDLPTARTRA